MSLFLLAFMKRIQGRTHTVMAPLIALAALGTLVVLLVVAAFATLCIKRLLSCTLGWLSGTLGLQCGVLTLFYLLRGYRTGLLLNARSFTRITNARAVTASSIPTCASTAASAVSVTLSTAACSRARDTARDTAAQSLLLRLISLQKRHRFMERFFVVLPRIELHLYLERTRCSQPQGITTTRFLHDFLENAVALST